MAKLSKRMQKIRAAVDNSKSYPALEALQLLKDLASVKFVESVDISINLGIDPRKSEQMVRGASVLPHGTGKLVRVAVFTQGANVALAKEAGADIVGLEDLAAEVKSGVINFDLAIASPDAMRVVGQLGQILGPRGLMPNPKVGTVSADVAAAVRNAKAGQVRFRADKAGIIHSTIGKVSFTPQALLENAQALLSEVEKLKPSTSKGIYLKQIHFSSTMGPGLAVDITTLKS
jgi:large subunit ribosomal protein L1